MSGISIGTQLCAPFGFDSLESGAIYYFLRNSTDGGRVLLVEFIIRPSFMAEFNATSRPIRLVTPFPVTKLMALTRERFETGLKNGRIIRSAVQLNMPPWLQGLKADNLTYHDEQRKRASKSHSERIADRLRFIEPLSNKFEQVLDSPNPDTIINKHARDCDPKQNETRLRLWFYTYLVFGRNKFSLHYPIQKIGIWIRSENSTLAKLGRPDKIKGSGSGYNVSAEVKEMILKGWKRYAKLGVQLTAIRRKTLINIFGCLTRTVQVGNSSSKQFWHPDGKPFPTLRQFCYHVLKEYGKEEMRITLYGYVKYRSNEQLTKGAFTSRTWNLMQSVERDAFVRESISSGLLDGSPMPAIHVVRIRDVASGLITGIGFSMGGETAASYRMALFCQAIDKVKFGTLIGYKINEGDWPSIGASPREIQDRGAGSTIDAFSRLEEYQPVTKQSPPSHSGQSKATVESTNPNKRKNSEAPSYQMTSLNPFQVVKVEIQNVLDLNDSIDVRSRVPPELAHAIPRATPLCLWNLFDSLGRTDAINMKFEDAVRAYLTKVQATLKGSTVTFLGRDYRDQKLDDLIQFRSTSSKQTLNVDIYILDACLQFIWIDIKGQLLELHVQFAIPVGLKIINMSIGEWKDYYSFITAQDNKIDEHRQAVIAEGSIRFRESEGYDRENVTRHKGRANKNTASSLNEGRATKEIFQNKGIRRK